MRITYRFEKRGAHWRLTIWVNGANIGMLCSGDGERDVLESVITSLRARHGTQID